MANTQQVLQDIIDGLNNSIIETEGIVQAQQGCLVALKRTRNEIIAKKRGIEEDEKREAEETAKVKCAKKRNSKPKKKGGQTPLKD